MFLVIKHLLRSTPGHGIEAFKKWDQDTINLNNQLQECKYKVHEAFCGKLILGRDEFIAVCLNLFNIILQTTLIPELL